MGLAVGVALCARAPVEEPASQAAATLPTSIRIIVSSLTCWLSKRVSEGDELAPLLSCRVHLGERAVIADVTGLEDIGPVPERAREGQVLLRDDHGQPLAAQMGELHGHLVDDHGRQAFA